MARAKKAVFNNPISATISILETYMPQDLLRAYLINMLRDMLRDCKLTEVQQEILLTEIKLLQETVKL